MVEAQEMQQLIPGVYRWNAFSPEHSVELTSHAIRVGRHVYIFDPIALAEQHLVEVLAGVTPVAIIVTNANHVRDSIAWRSRHRIPIWASREASLLIPRVYHFPNTHQWFDWNLHKIKGGSDGEMGLFLKDQGLMVVGDCLTNLPKYGLSLLTEKYCSDMATLRHSVRQLLSTSFNKILMAHGNPLLENASRQVEKIPGLG